jgi:hypothetical protein
MASPFPGMNPYLESPAFWSEFHNRLMVAIADDLSPQLRPRYRVAIEQRVYLSRMEQTTFGSWARPWYLNCQMLQCSWFVMQH